jgi:hypothetical protein
VQLDPQLQLRNVWHSQATNGAHHGRLKGNSRTENNKPNIFKKRRDLLTINSEMNLDTGSAQGWQRRAKL